MIRDVVPYNLITIRTGMFGWRKLYAIEFLPPFTTAILGSDRTFLRHFLSPWRYKSAQKMRLIYLEPRPAKGKPKMVETDVLAGGFRPVPGGKLILINDAGYMKLYTIDGYIAVPPEWLETLPKDHPMYPTAMKHYEPTYQGIRSLFLTYIIAHTRREQEEDSEEYWEAYNKMMEDDPIFDFEDEDDEEDDDF